VEKTEVAMFRWILSLRSFALFAYLCFCVGISGFALGSFAKIIQGYLAVDYNYRTETLMVIGQVIFQWSFMSRASWLERKKYAVIALTISMLGSLLLLPLLPLLAYARLYGVSETVSLAYFLCVVVTIFLAHHKLIKYKRLPTVLTFTWVLYRLLLLTYLITPRQVQHG
jgi:hypothetical protein